MTIKAPGTQRVIVEGVTPQVDHGRYPAKRTVGESVVVGAHVFADGHDTVRAEVRYRRRGSRSWQIAPMTALGNDEWQGKFIVTKEGSWEFFVAAWIDHVVTWHKGILKKIEANLQVSLELAEGAQLAQLMVEHYGKESLSGLTGVIPWFVDNEAYDKALEVILSAEFEDLIYAFPIRNNVSTNDRTLLVAVEPARNLFTTWYEVFPRSTGSEPGAHGTFRDVKKRLPRIAAMGFDVLYLPPIHPIGEVNRKGKNNSVTAEKGEPGSPWAIGSKHGGHKDIHPQLGTLRDFKSLIKACKDLDMDLAMDIAFQCAPDHPYVKKHPEWFKKRPDGSIMYAENPPKKYQDIVPFNFESEKWEELWGELKSIIDYWIDAGIRIFRIDNPHTKPQNFWQWLIAEVNKKHPEVIFLSEAFTRPKVMAGLAKAGFQQSYTYFTWRVSKVEIMEYMEELTNGDSRNYFRPNFWPNTPDILPYHLQHANENTFIARFALAATLSSNYGMYGPVFEHYDNQPLGEKEEYLNSEKYEIRYHDWEQVTRLTEIISIVNHIRKNHPALQTTWNLHFCPIENDNLLAYLKYDESRTDFVLVVVNLDPFNIQTGYLGLPLDILEPKGGLNIKLRNLITGNVSTWTNEWNYVQVDPNQLPFYIYSLEVHESNLN